MTKGVRPIHLPGTRALGSVRERVVVALNAWAVEWVSDWSDHELTAHDAVTVGAAENLPQDEQSAIFEYSSSHAGDGSLWVSIDTDSRERLGRAVVGQEAMSGLLDGRGLAGVGGAVDGPGLPDMARTDSWIKAVIDRACIERDRALCTALLGLPSSAMARSAGTVPREMFAFGSGAVSVSCQHLGLHAIVDSNVWRGTAPTERMRLPARPGLTPLSSALRAASARLEVLLGSTELELPQLLDLRAGDVLRLTQRLDQPLSLLCEGRLLARAALGERAGMKSIQLKHLS